MNIVLHIVRLVRLNWKFLRRMAAPMLLLVLSAGCGGFSASRTVSPLSFFLPGLMKADPPPTPVPAQQDLSPQPEQSPPADTPEELARS